MAIQYEISPPKGLLKINLPELWRYRELFYVLSWRDIKIRYKQTALGVLWAIFQPFITMVVFSVFFGKLAKVPSDGIPYPIFAYSGLLFWTYFSNALSNTSNSLIQDANLIKKVYFPRVILPMSTALTPLIDFFIAVAMLFLLMYYFHYPLGWLGIVLMPILLAISFLIATGLGLILASVNAKYRDVRYILPFFIQLLLYLTPVIYPVSLIPERYQKLLYLNPMTGVITTARSALLGTASVNWTNLAISLGAGVVFFVIGLTYFRRMERFFADVL